MPGLGIGHSTQFSMGSNHQTALNHNFRDTTPYDHKQPKVKCSSCGVWVKKGADCYLCKRFEKKHAGHDSGAAKPSSRPASAGVSRRGSVGGTTSTRSVSEGSEGAKAS